MRIEGIEAFVAEQLGRGYWDGYSMRLQHKPVHTLFKSFERDGEMRGYQIALEVWDSRELHEHGEIRVQMNMLMNHETPLHIDRMDVMMMCDEMDVQEFERRCAELWRSMLQIFPRP